MRTHFSFWHCVLFVKVNCTFVVCVECLCAKHIEEADGKKWIEEEERKKKKKQPKIELRNENSYCADESVQHCVAMPVVYGAGYKRIGI